MGGVVVVVVDGCVPTKVTLPHYLETWNHDNTSQTHIRIRTPQPNILLSRSVIKPPQKITEVR